MLVIHHAVPLPVCWIVGHNSTYTRLGSQGKANRSLSSCHKSLPPLVQIEGRSRKNLKVYHHPFGLSITFSLPAVRSQKRTSNDGMTRRLREMERPTSILVRGKMDEPPMDYHHKEWEPSLPFLSVSVLSGGGLGGVKETSIVRLLFNRDPLMC